MFVRVAGCLSLLITILRFRRLHEPQHQWQPGNDCFCRPSTIRYPAITLRNTASDTSSNGSKQRFTTALILALGSCSSWLLFCLEKLDFVFKYETLPSATYIITARQSVCNTTGGLQYEIQDSVEIKRRIKPCKVIYQLITPQLKFSTVHQWYGVVLHG